jgi:YVTN family beta-propeller protein
VSANVKVGANPDGVSADPKSNKIYVANSGDGTVSVIDGTTNTVSDTIPAGTNVYGISMNPSTGIVYVGNDDPGIVYVISDIGKTQTTNYGILDDVIQFFSHLFNIK